MRHDLPIERIIAEARIYQVGDALDRGARQRWAMKPEHDALYRYALERGLARWLTIAVGKHQRQPQALLALAETRIRKVRWWPANGGTRPAPDVLLIRTDTFDNDWAKVRTIAEPESRASALWHDDPALFTRLPSGDLVCRTACVGHEGMVFYLAYDQEKEWIGMLEQSGFELSMQGRDAYLEIIRRPGLVAESQLDAE